MLDTHNHELTPYIMRITSRTRTRDILPLLTEARAKELAERVPCVPLAKPLLKMSVGEFIEATTETFALRFFREKRALRAFGMYREYLSQLKQITAYIGRYDVERTPKEQAAAEGIAFPSLGERILVECVKHYGLHSTAEAERLPLADWLLMVKADGSAAQYQQRLAKMQAAENKRGR